MLQGEAGRRTMFTAECPGCGRIIDLGRRKRIWILACPQCRAVLEVVGADPLTLCWAYPELEAPPSRSGSIVVERHDEGCSSIATVANAELLGPVPFRVLA